MKKGFLHSTNFLLYFFFVVVFILNSSFANATAQAVNSEKETPLLFNPEWPAQIRPGTTLGSGRTLSFIDILVPVVGRKEYLLFISPKVILGSNDTNEENIGCGYRQLLFDDKCILGANFYYDSLRSKNNFRHHQLGFGTETLTKWIDFRANFYFPISGKKHLRDDVSYSFGQRSVIAWTTSHYEEPLRGFDYEGGLLIPYLSDVIETRAYMGGYHYHSGLGNNINGIKTRIEARPAPAFTIEAQIKHDNVFHTDVYVGGYVSVPFNIGNIFQKKNPFEGWKEAIQFAKGPRKLRKRMTDMVIRDIDVVSDEGTSAPTESKVHDVTFVDNSNAGDPNEDGSFNHPYDTVQKGVTNATGDGWVYVRSGNGNYVENVVLTNNVVLWGSGYSAYPGLGGNAYPVVDGGGAGNVITCADNNTVMGITAQNANIGISCVDVSGCNIHHNVIMTQNLYGIYFSATAGNAASNLTASNNTSTGSGWWEIFIDGSAAGVTISDVTVSNNTCTNSIADGIGIYSWTGSTVEDVTFLNNTLTGNAFDGIYVDAWGGDAIVRNITFNGNTISGNGWDGIGFRLWNACSVENVSMTNNTIINNGMNGVYIQDSGTGTTAVIDLGGGNLLPSGGYNSIYGNNIGGGFFDLNNEFAATQVTATDNWWGVTPPLVGQFSGNIDYNPWLSSDPN